MSQIFRVGGQVVWNPSNGVGLLYVRSAEAVQPLVGEPTGIAVANADEWTIDLAVFERFIGALVDRYRSSSHLVLRSLLEGFIATSLVLVERGGRSAAALDAELALDMRDVQVSTGGVGRLAEPDRLMRLRTAHSKAMPI